MVDCRIWQLLIKCVTMFSKTARVQVCWFLQPSKHGKLHTLLVVWVIITHLCSLFAHAAAALLMCHLLLDARPYDCTIDNVLEQLHCQLSNSNFDLTTFRLPAACTAKVHRSVLPAAIGTCQSKLCLALLVRPLRKHTSPTKTDRACMGQFV